MVKVVGKSELFVKQVTCPDCSSVLEYVKNEVQSYDTLDYSGGTDRYYYVNCPCCSHKVHVS